MQHPCKTSCSAGQLANEAGVKEQKSFTNTKLGDHQCDNWVQGKCEARICELDKLGLPIPSIPGRRVLDRKTFERLKSGSVVVTEEERGMAAKLHELDEERKKTESVARKAELQKYNTYKTKGPKLSQIEEEAQKKKDYLLNRAFELRQDQEDEIKQCNSIIMNTKCHAIRSAQIAEKERLQKQLKDEERRVEELMEQQRMLAGKKYEKAAEADRLKKKLQAMTIAEQIKENEIERDWQAAREEEDARIRKEAAIEAQRAEVKDYKEKLLKQAEMRKEFLEMNAQLSKMKKEEIDLEKMEILRIKAYNKEKYEREMAFEEELKKQKSAKDHEIAKIQASQKAWQDLQAEKDELNAIRTQDKVEKEWRRKDLEEAMKKIRINEDLKKARSKQIQDQQTNQVQEVQREKTELEKIIKLNIVDIEKQEEIKEQNKMKITEHRKNLLKQINEKELEKIEEKKKFFREGLKFQEDVSSRKKTLRATMQKKIEGLKAHNLPDKYLHEIERRMKLTTDLPS